MENIIRAEVLDIMGSYGVIYYRSVDEAEESCKKYKMRLLKYRPITEDDLDEYYEHRRC